MKILVVGGGGREHAIIKSLKKNPEITEIFAAPGNGGIAKDATCVAIGATEIDKIVAFAVENAIVVFFIFWRAPNASTTYFPSASP